MHKSSCLLYHKKSRLLNFFCSISCVFSDLVGYQNKVYNVRILELWFSTLITYGNYLGNVKKMLIPGSHPSKFHLIGLGCGLVLSSLGDVILLCR